MNKKTVGLLTALFCMLSGSVGGTAHAMPMGLGVQPSIAVTLDGYPLPLSPEPIFYKERTMVPFRALSNALGINVDWDDATQTVIAKDGTRDLRLQIGNKQATVDGKTVQLDAEPVLLDDHTYIPLRFFSENVGAKVEWDGATQTVHMQSPKRKMETMVFYGLGSYDKRGYLPKFDEATFTWSILDENGHFSTNQSEYKWPESGADELLGEVKAEKVGTSLMVFSANQKGELTNLLADDALQAQFVQDVAAKAKEQGMDTVTLDFESLMADAGEGYVAFVKKVGDALHAQNTKLDVVVHPLNGAYSGYDYKGLAASADRLLVMAYSYVDDKLPQPDDKVDQAIQLALKEVPPSKLLLGINAFSETDATVQEKIGLAKRYHLAGVGFWILVSFDDTFMQGIDRSLLLHGEE